MDTITIEDRPPLRVAYDEDSEKVQTLYEKNYRDIPNMLRRLADGIEGNEYGAVGEVACVVMCDKVAVFGWGPEVTSTSTPVLLQAGAHLYIRELANHSNNTKEKMP